MASILVAGKEYPIPESFTYRELDIIKQTAGVRPAEFLDAFRAGDAMVLVALAIIVKRRAGETVDVEALKDMDASSIEEAKDDPDEEDDSRPPDGGGDTPPSPTPTEPGPHGSPPSLSAD